LIVLVLVVLGAIAGGTLFVLQRTPADTIAAAAIDPDTMRLVPDSVRIKVEVLNASGQRGLARRVTQYLRDRGFDVVSVGNAAEPSDSSIVIDRSGHPEWSAWAARAMQGARLQTAPDSTRYLDLTIHIGRNFRAPPQVVYP
jgi:hypothetical protein